MATTQQMREGEAELARIVQWVSRQAERGGAEAMAAAPPVHPHITGYCNEARSIAASLAQFPGGTRRRGARHTPIQSALRNAKSRVDSLDGQVRGRIGQYSRNDLDLLLGCTIAPLQAAFRSAGSTAPGSLTAMQNAANQRMQNLRAAGLP